MKTIIVPTDFSAISNNAIDYAIDLAKATGSSILLFHAYQVPVSMTDVPIVLLSVEDLQKSNESKMDDVKKSVQERTGNSIKIYAETKLGDTVDELEDVCAKVKPFAVVMGTKGATGMERVLFGSTTLTTIRHLNWPVIVVPPGKKYSTIRKIGFACDFREVVHTTPTHFIKDFVKEFNAELHVLNVDRESKVLSAETYEQSELLRNMIADMNPQYHFIDKEDIEEGLNETGGSINDISTIHSQMDKDSGTSSIPLDSRQSKNRNIDLNEIDKIQNDILKTLKRLGSS